MASCFGRAMMVVASSYIRTKSSVLVLMPGQGGKGEGDS